MNIAKKISCLPLLCALLLSGCAKSAEPYARTAFLFDTAVTITIYDTDAARADSLLTRCFTLCESYEGLFSRTMEGTDISSVNAHSGSFVAVHPETAELIRLGISYGELSDGLFDITIGPLSSLWDFHGGSTVPDAGSLADAAALVDYRSISLKTQDGAPAVRLDKPGAALDLGGIAKGYMADKLKEMLQNEGVSCAIISLGGNVLTIGSRPDGAPFRVGIRQPFDDTGAMAEVVEVTDRSVVTSGVYERYFYVGDTLYHHVLNPSTGLPMETDLYGATILSDSSADGDALSTICLSLGSEKGLEFIESLPGIEAVFITSDDQIIKSSGL